MEEGGGELELKTWNASETIMDAVTSFEASAVTKQIALQSDIAEEVHMEGDAARIHQLVSLLVDNAVKYTPEGGKIHIFWRKNGKKQNFRWRIPAIPCRKVISTTSLTASTVRMRRGPGKAAAMESAFPWQLQL